MKPKKYHILLRAITRLSLFYFFLPFQKHLPIQKTNSMHPKKRVLGMQNVSDSSFTRCSLNYFGFHLEYMLGLCLFFAPDVLYHALLICSSGLSALSMSSCCSRSFSVSYLVYLLCKCMIVVASAVSYLTLFICSVYAFSSETELFCI